MEQYTCTSSKVVRGELKLVWPNLKNIWLTDKEYGVMSVSRLAQLLNETQADRLPYIKKKGECEEFSLILHSAIKQKNIFDDKSKLTWAFGECIGRKFVGFKGVHSANVCLTKEGVYLIEPQTDAYWKADPVSDDIFFIKM